MLLVTPAVLTVVAIRFLSHLKIGRVFTVIVTSRYAGLHTSVHAWFSLKACTGRSDLGVFLREIQ